MKKIDWDKVLKDRRFHIVVTGIIIAIIIMTVSVIFEIDYSKIFNR